MDPLTGITIQASVDAAGVIGYRLSGEGSEDVQSAIDRHGGVKSVYREMRRVNALNRDSSGGRRDRVTSNRMQLSLGSNSLPLWAAGLGGAVVRALAGCAGGQSPASSEVSVATCSA